jgi:hypothetical protein
MVTMTSHQQTVVNRERGGEVKKEVREKRGIQQDAPNRTPKTPTGT